MDGHTRVSNFLKLYDMAREWEIETGTHYYDEQRARIGSFCMPRMKKQFYPKGWENHMVGAFAVLSPNNSEAMNYRALKTCLANAAG